MAYRSHSTFLSNSANSNLTIAYPVGLAADDIFVLVAGWDAYGTNVTWPSGFTEIQNSQISSPDGGRLAAAYKVATGSESGNLTQSGFISGQDSMAVTLLAFSGCDTAAPINASSTNNSTAGNSSPVSVTGSTITTDAACDLLHCYMMDKYGSATITSTPASGFAQRSDLSASGNYSSIGTATKDGASAGATGSVTASVALSGGTSGWISFLIAIKKSGGAGGAARQPTGLSALTAVRRSAFQ